MNSLNILSGLTTTPPTTPPRSRTGSSANVETLSSSRRNHDESNFDSLSEKLGHIKSEDFANKHSAEHIPLDEKTPLLDEDDAEKPKPSGGWRIHRRIADAVVYSVKVVYNTITAPGRYVIACFYDQHGHFSALLPIKNLRNLMSRKRRMESAAAVGLDSTQLREAREEKAQRRTSHQRSPSVDTVSSVSTYATSDTENELDRREDSPARHTRSRTAAAAAMEKDEIKPQNKSIRIKLHNEEALLKRKAQKAQLRSRSNNEDVEKVASSLKSPSSGTTTKMTRYPRTPAPPRPLIPRRQPSYAMSYSTAAPKKTLIIDLDETLIHSMAKGGRMSQGHMVEVRLGGPVSSSGVSLGPGVPILYYVHERPGCHEFLRKVCKWYNLIVFTASVQEYADPVIDWLERERKYFSGRYYRQHCTFRNGAYIKDLAQVEPDLSRVMILDNSPMSYIFHEDNAIPIEGWISDPTDHELLHLVPLFEGLQYVTDVRALLALRQGQAQQA
ncbi:hypothetical protein Q7P37_009190 [Cladosporium fusiforme]